MIALIINAMSVNATKKLSEQQSECYSIFGEENITYEIIQDGVYMAYTNGTFVSGELVYAGGREITEDEPYVYGITGYIYQKIKKTPLIFYETFKY